MDARERARIAEKKYNKSERGKTARKSYVSIPEVRARMAEVARRWAADHPIKSKITMYKSNAKRREIEYDLDPRLFEDLVTDKCFYCHAEPDPLNGIDRVDNSIGYTENNVVSCCKICNLAKKELSRFEFESWAIRVADVARRLQWPLS